MSESRDAEMGKGTRTVSEILQELTRHPYNLTQICDEDDHALDDLSQECWNCMRLDDTSDLNPIKRFFIARSLNTNLTVSRWQDIERKYPPIVELLEAIYEVPDASFKPFWNLSVLRMRTNYTDVCGGGQKAIEDAWSRSYEGNTASILRRTLERYMKVNTPGHRYTHCVELVQSSGTGKSRMVSELGRTVVSIPLSLQDTSRKATQYPPPDDPVFLKWLKGPPEDRRPSERLLDHYRSFLFAMMSVTETRLKEIEAQENLHTSKLITATEGERRMSQTMDRLAKLAEAFHDKMMLIRTTTEVTGSRWRYSEYRQTFYKDVIKEAENFRSTREETPIGHGLTLAAGRQELDAMANRLRRFLDPYSLCNERLLFVIALDEAHTLAGLLGFLQLAMYNFSVPPFLTILLSTAELLHHFLPADKAFGPTSRIQTIRILCYEPITTIGFDTFAHRVTGDGRWSLGEVASTSRIVHLGRALFATRYDAGDETVKQSIIDFAMAKLLNHDGELSAKSIPSGMMLACLAIRLGLDFRSDRHDRQQKTQVESHMRLYSSVEPGFNAVKTLSPSEPLLAEGALNGASELSRLLGSKWSPPSILLEHVKNSCVSLGSQGEVIPALLLTLARDKALHAQNEQETIPLPLLEPSAHRADGHRRIVPVGAFLESLLSVDVSSLRALAPRTACTPADRHKTLSAAFADARIWFNHFVRVTDPQTVQREHLCAMVSRGAAMLCAESQTHVISLVIPIVFGGTLTVDNVSAILVQVHNSRFMDDKKDATRLLDTIDPFELGLFLPGDDAAAVRPIIRMVFTLAGTTPATTLVAPPSGANPGAFTTYDIWCHGLAAGTFRVIDENEHEAYAALLDLSQPYYARAHAEVPGMGDAFCAMRAGVSARGAFSGMFYNENGGL